METAAVVPARAPRERRTQFATEAAATRPDVESLREVKDAFKAFIAPSDGTVHLARTCKCPRSGWGRQKYRSSPGALSFTNS